MHVARLGWEAIKSLDIPESDIVMETSRRHVESAGKAWPDCSHQGLRIFHLDSEDGLKDE